MHAAEDTARAAAADGAPLPLDSVEGFVRQVMGRRDCAWHTYRHSGRDHRHGNHLRATEPVPRWMAELDRDAVDAPCPSGVLTDLRRDGRGAPRPAAGGARQPRAAARHRPAGDDRLVPPPRSSTATTG
ncbi:hypothetical protein ACI79J_14590 [Geodermatophilus sp. SYSU D01062]